MTDDVKSFLAEFESSLDGILTSALNADSPISEAVRYAVSGGGKRVRPTAVYLGAASIGNDFNLQQALSVAAAIEMIHSYSLVHDDLPAMDNDDYRRGKLSTHKKFGEANGILAGDQLLTLAMNLMISHSRLYGSVYLKAASYIADAAQKMADGQAFDLAQPENANGYLDMYRLKTGAIIEASFLAGAVLASASDKQLAVLKKYAAAVGLAFQLADDLLDIGEKNSYVGLSGQAAGRTLLNKQTEIAVSAANELPCGNALAEFARKLAERKN